MQPNYSDYKIDGTTYYYNNKKIYDYEDLEHLMKGGTLDGNHPDVETIRVEKKTKLNLRRN